MLNSLETPLQYKTLASINKGHTSGDKCMIMLHGRGDSLESYEILAKEINVTGLSYLLLNAPAKEGFGYTWYNDSFSTSDPLYVKSLNLLNDLLKELSHHFESRDIFIFGFSQGARMALDLLSTTQFKLGACVAFSPRVTPFSPKNEINKETPILVHHGLYDPVIPFQETQPLIEGDYKKHYQNLEFESYEIAHEIDIMQIIKLRNWINNYL